ncbi:recombinase family protein [Qiania dongpingensis]|uniref:Recombinase family protein n=1 Tax=Qiania dongpingensis TaxID=2763669 RepID=A0A7G9G7H2_9FIRM|nr:recombinase family protein [Qiania dongpingensis]QNM06754.1 recombinase family protein [Qiania dongpingensis]
MAVREKYSAALYMRLSKDDSGFGESASISSQRKILRRYALENGFCVHKEYVDDGISGLTFNRPGFKRMIQDIENKQINLVITKDLSRLGRNYIMTGRYTEFYFPSKKVRCIAVNDNYDSDDLYSDMVPFRNVINEMYARDTSRKIRSALLARMQEGAFMGAHAPYGYERDAGDKHHLVVDEVTGTIVKGIFQKAAAGVLPIQIARELNECKIPTPSEYRCMSNPSLRIENFSKRREWTSATIIKILRNPVYLGHMAQRKTSKLSFKCPAAISLPASDWIIVENTHAPLVTNLTFELAARRSRQRTCIQGNGFNNLFSGIARCGDCGRRMSAVSSRKKGAEANLACGAYKQKGTRGCSNHFIAYDDLYEVVLCRIQSLMRRCGFSEPEKLTQDLLFHLVDHIEICQGHFGKTPSGRVKFQTIKIFFRFRPPE